MKKVIKSYASPKAYDVTSNITGKYTTSGFASNASSKEQMKMDVMRLSAGAGANVAGDQPGMCTECLALTNLTPKEQMKMKVVGLYNCPMDADMAGNMTAKCSTVCHMNLTAAKSK